MTIRANVSGCFFAGRPGAGPCDGSVIRAHLIPKQRIKRERDSALARRRRGEPALPHDEALLASSESALVWSSRCWVPMCGGPMGNGGHHGKFDAGFLRIARAEVPETVVAFARRHGLEWSLEADYGLEG